MKRHRMLLGGLLASVAGAAGAIATQADAAEWEPVAYFAEPVRNSSGVIIYYDCHWACMYGLCCYPSPF